MKFEEIKKDAPAEAGTSDQSKGNLNSTPLENDNTVDVAQAIEALASLVIWHPKAYDFIYHLTKMAEILKGGSENG